MTLMQATDIDPCRVARDLYWSGYRVARIAEMLNVSQFTIHTWKARGEWQKTEPFVRCELSVEARYIRLINKEVKEGNDFKEIDLLGRELERAERIKRTRRTGVDGDSGQVERTKGSRKKVEKNAVSDEQREKLVEAFRDSNLDYQKAWYAAGIKHRIRNILKSRQIGATWYFAREAFIDALTTGRNQIFLSASKAQAHVFRQYIVQFAKDVAGVELRGDPMVLPNGATLYFLGTSARTAQSYHGNLYFDEYFWTQSFQRLRDVSSGMAIHKQWRQTYFSTPSSLSHDAYPFWSGAHYNNGRPESEKVQIDLSHASLSRGKVCGDGHWRQIVTVEDAIAGGCRFFDIEQLRREYSPDVFANLLLCKFIDDFASVFSLPDLLKCGVDSWEVWEDFQPLVERPFGYRPVWVGYDPNGGNGQGDSAALVVLAPPAVLGGKFRLLYHKKFNGLDYDEQAAAIKAIAEQYNVAFIGIDTTGIGDAVYKKVVKFFPAATAFHYSPQLKTRLVLKALDVVRKGRFEYDAGLKEVPASFLAIRKTITASGTQMTFKADRSEQASHADIAWATMHAMSNENLDGEAPTTNRILEIF